MAANFFRLLWDFELLERMASTRGAVVRFIVSILQSRYFIIAAAFYLLLMLILGPIAVSHYQLVRGNFEQGDQLLVLPPPGPPPPPMPQQAVSEKSTTAKRNVDVAVKSAVSESTLASAKQTASTRLTVSAPSAYVQPSAQIMAPVVGAVDIKVGTDMGAKIAAAEVKRLIGVRDFQKGWVVGGTGGGGGSGGSAGANFRHGGGKSVRAKFTVYQAKYQDGDWNCNPTALANLMLQIRAWSRDRIDANLYPEVLDVGTEQIFTIRPPFIYLTGHKDFHFLDSEVRNLRDYLMVGGAIWGDSALAGRRSRFDIAFRREMAKVMPDREFELVKPDHAMFDTFFQDINLPVGINFYHEPAELINIGDELAVLYTLNGYGHFWEARLNKENKIEWKPIRVNHGTAEKPDWRWQHVYGPHLYYPHEESRVIYRNINDQTVTAAYKFGINVVVHLLVRYQEKFRFLPKDLPVSESRLPQTGKSVGAKGANAPAGAETEDKESAAGSKKDKRKDKDKSKDKSPAKPGGK